MAHLLEATYAGSRSYDLEAGFDAYNEPSAEFQAQCDVTLGGSRTLLRPAAPEPVLRRRRLRGHDPVHEPDALALRAEPAVPGVRAASTRNQNNIGKLIYDSAQFVANKRLAKGVTINASYTWVPRWTEIGGYVDAVSGLLNEGPYFSHRKHRITASGVWELPWFRNERSIAGYLLGGWSMAPMLVYQSGQPWDMPGNVDLAPGVNLDDDRAARQEGRAVHLRREAVHRPAPGERHLRPAVRLDRRTAAPSPTS